MARESIDLQNRVAADLTTRASSFSITGWTAAAQFAPTFELKELATLRVIVCPATRASEVTSRTLRSRELGVWVGIITRLSIGQTPEGDFTQTAALIDFAEEVHDLFVPRTGGFYRLDAYRATGVTANPLYDPDKLRANREFRAAMLVTFGIDQQ